MENHPKSSTEQSVNLLDRFLNSLDSLTKWVWQPTSPDELKWRQLLRAILRIHYIVVRESKRDRINLRASALTFTVVLSLVPMLALGTAVLKGLGAGDQMRQAAYRFVEQLEEPVTLPDSAATPPSPDRENANPPAGQPISEPAVAPGTASGNLTGHLRKAVDQIFDYVDRTDFAALGAFGILGLVIAAISVLGSIEQAMNTIWQVDSNRPLGRKVIDYLALMILLPITVNLGLATEATLQSPVMLVHFHNFLPAIWLGKFLLNMLPLLAVLATFTILYRFLPNTNVGLLPALAGGVFGGLSWLLVQIVYVKLQIGVARYNAIYGSFATLPLFLIWIYVAWVVFLAGAETAFAVQVRRIYQWRELLLTPVNRLALAFEIMENVLADFRLGAVTSRAILGQRLNQPDQAIAGIADDLVTAGKLRRVIDNGIGFVPAAPEEEIKPAEFVDLIFGPEDTSIKQCSLARTAMAAARSALTGKKISCRRTEQPIENH